ncbi:hypothetical protein ACYOEI_00305 [Singulisphaera rosea]
MTAAKPPGPYLDEIDARIAEAEQYGDQKAADFARWQRGFVQREWARRVRRQERSEGKGR